MLTAVIFVFGRTIPLKSEKNVTKVEEGNHSHEDKSNITVDTLLGLAKQQLRSDQLGKIENLEQKLEQQEHSQTPDKEEKLHLYHQLARFWADSAGIFEPYAWYRAEAARLENSEKNLTFAARLFLENLQQDEVGRRKQWKALQAKDLFERVLKLNPSNDSAKIGLGASYLFGNIAANPMEGIIKIREVVEKDSTNVYGQMMLVKGSVFSGQYDKAIGRLETVLRIKPDDLEATLLLAELYERTGEKSKAVNWYQKSLELTDDAELKSVVSRRIEELRK